MYVCTKINSETHQKLLLNKRRELRKSNRGGEFDQSVICMYGKTIMKRNVYNVQLIYPNKFLNKIKF
jgi:hypothetical protein